MRLHSCDGQSLAALWGVGITLQGDPERWLLSVKAIPQGRAQEVTEPTKLQIQHWVKRPGWSTNGDYYRVSLGLAWMSMSWGAMLLAE